MDRGSHEVKRLTPLGRKWVAAAATDMRCRLGLGASTKGRHYNKRRRSKGRRKLKRRKSKKRKSKRKKISKRKRR